MPDEFDHEKSARATRTVPVAHAEAFQVMLYRRVDMPKIFVWIWNSRDGVTPFGCSIDGVEYRHDLNGYPPTYTAILPAIASHVFVSYNWNTWDHMQRLQWQRFSELPDDNGPPGAGGADFRKRYPKPEDWVAVSPFEHGQPRRLTREEFLRQTPEWMGKHSA